LQNFIQLRAKVVMISYSLLLPNARVSNLNDLVGRVAHIELTVDLTSAIVVSLNSESIDTIAAECVNDLVAVDSDMTKISSVVFNEIEINRELTALGVGFSSDLEIE